MICRKCGLDKKLHAKGLCRKCYDSEPRMKEKRKQWKNENVYARLREEDVLKLVMR